MNRGILPIGGLHREWSAPAAYAAGLLADPGEASGCSTNTAIINLLSDPLVPTASQRSHAQTFRDYSSSYKIDYVIVKKNLLSPEGHQNRKTESKVTVILVKG